MSFDTLSKQAINGSSNGEGTSSDSDMSERSSRSVNLGSHELKRKYLSSATETPNQIKKSKLSPANRGNGSDSGQINHSNSEKESSSATASFHENGDQEPQATREFVAQNVRSETSYQAPYGFERMFDKVPRSQKINLSDKQIWHVVAPKSVAIGNMFELDIKHTRNRKSIISPGISQYEFVKREDFRSQARIFLIPNESGTGYQYKTSSFRNILQLEQQVSSDSQMLSQLTINNLFEAAPVTSNAVHRQEEGLKTRHWASGFERNARSVQ